MRRKLPALNRYQVLLLCKVMVWIGFAALAVALVLFIRDLRLGIPQLVAMAVGLLGTAGSGVLGMAYLNCPHCSASLLTNGLLPKKIPQTCPECGKELDAAPEEKEEEQPGEKN